MRHVVKFVGLVAVTSLLVTLCSTTLNDLEESEEESEKDSILNYSALENPFRVQKINLLWEKARYCITASDYNPLHVCAQEQARQ